MLYWTYWSLKSNHLAGEWTSTLMLLILLSSSNSFNRRSISGKVRTSVSASSSGAPLQTSQRQRVEGEDTGGGCQAGRAEIVTTDQGVLRLSSYCTHYLIVINFMIIHNTRIVILIKVDGVHNS